MLRIWTAFQGRVIRDERAAGMVEYALLLVLVALALVVSISFFTGAVGNSFSNAGASLAGS